MKIILFVGTILYAFFCKNQKNFWLWCAILFSFIIWTSENFADFDNYERYFLRVTRGEKGILYMGIPAGWYYLCLGFAKIGLSYRGMMVVVIILSCYLVHRFVKTFDCQESVFWGLFIMFPGLVQVIQIRFYLGTAIVFLSLCPLIRKEKWGLVKFIIGVLISYFVHASCAIFIIFAFAALFDRYGTRKAIVLSICGTTLIYLASSYIPQIVSGYIPTVKFERYFESTISKTTTTWFLRIVLVWIVCVLIGYYCYKRLISVKRRSDDKELIEFNTIVAPKMMICIVLLCLTLPFLTFDRNFHRFLEVGYMILFVFIARLWRYEKWKSKNDKYLYMTIFMVIMIRLTYIYTPFSSIIQPFSTFSGFHSLFL